jgi:hypothetical protein
MTRPIVQIAPGNFPEPQQRALNDALAGLSAGGDGATATKITQRLADGATTATFSLTQTSTDYAPSFAPTWFTMIRIIEKTATRLRVEFSNPPSAGDEITLSVL